MKGWKWAGPAVAVLVLVIVVPLVRILWTALHRSTLTAPDLDTWVGLDNVTEVLTSRGWWLAVAASLVVVAVVVATQVVLGCLFAAALHRWSQVWPPARVLVLLPVALLSVVGVVLWRDAADTGFVAGWFGQAGSLTVVALAEIWRGTGLVVVVVAVALSRVPRTLLIAATADGATAGQRWLRVVLPSIAPALAAIATFQVLVTFRVLDGPLLLDRAGATQETATGLMWGTQFSDFALGLGAAMSLVLLLVAVVLTALVVPLFRVRRAL